jgi:hypothetical protein
MNKFILAFAMLLAMAIAPLAGAQSTSGRQIKLVLGRGSNVDPVLITKHFGEKCPNVTLTTNRQRSDFLLQAWGWSGDYRFLIIAKGGDQIYATQTAILSNAVKDVCHFLNTRAPAAASY